MLAAEALLHVVEVEVEVEVEVAVLFSRFNIRSP
jgi:hypothetical protein